MAIEMGRCGDELLNGDFQAHHYRLDLHIAVLSLDAYIPLLRCCFLFCTCSTSIWLWTNRFPGGSALYGGKLKWRWSLWRLPKEIGRDARESNSSPRPPQPPSLLLYVFFQTRSHCEALAVLKLTEILYLCFSYTGIKNVHHSTP